MPHEWGWQTNCNAKPTTIQWTQHMLMLCFVRQPPLPHDKNHHIECACFSFVIGRAPSVFYACQGCRKYTGASVSQLFRLPPDVRPTTMPDQAFYSAMETEYIDDVCCENFVCLMTESIPLPVGKLFPLPTEWKTHSHAAPSLPLSKWKPIILMVCVVKIHLLYHDQSQPFWICILFCNWETFICVYNGMVVGQRICANHWGKLFCLPPEWETGRHAIPRLLRSSGHIIH